MSASRVVPRLAATPTRAPAAGHEAVATVSIDKMYILMYIVSMLARYSIAEARAQLPAIIDKAESGVHVELTRRGEPVAVLVSTHEFERLCGRQTPFSQSYRQFLTTVALKEIGVDREFAASLRDRSRGRDVAL